MRLESWTSRRTSASSAMVSSRLRRPADMDEGYHARGLSPAARLRVRLCSMSGRGASRIIARVIVFLLLVGGGAIVNVAVAWGCLALNHRFGWDSTVKMTERGSVGARQTWERHFGASEFVSPR